MHQTFSRKHFPRFQAIDTRWADNDIYGHVNNVTYYAYFDTAVNRFLIDAGLDIHAGDTIAFVVDSHCSYYQPVCFPDLLELGLSVIKLGNSSVTYQLGVFRQGEDSLCALGEFVHVFVDRQDQRPRAIPDGLRVALSGLVSGS
ncbi:acyl-CoA thioesterase [Simiduia agarivorans]|nr:thioesterase family protein [Simiduia agarivorans]